jgi:hypothetical protein
VEDGEPRRTVPGRRPKTYRRIKLITSGLVVMTGIVGLLSSPAFAAGTLTKVSWAVSNSQTAATSVTYSFAFTTATAGTLASVTMTVPTGTTAPSLAAGAVYGLGAGTVSLASNTLTYTITTPASVNAGIPIYLSFTGLTNSSTAGSYASTITTENSSATVDAGTSGSVTFGPSSTGVTVSVGQTLTFTNNMPSFTLAVDPSELNDVQSQVVVLTVQTNAANGYTLAAEDTGLSRSGPDFTIPAVSTGPTLGVPSFPASGWGASATLSTGGADGAVLAAGFAGGDWVGYPSTAANFLTTTGPTGATADTLTLTDQVAVNYTVPNGTYTDTITYVATPSF